MLCSNRLFFYKTRNWFQDVGYDRQPAEALAAHTEYDEMLKWRQVLMDPNGTFYDLLKISIESPAMIIYLDTYVNEKTDWRSHKPRRPEGRTRHAYGSLKTVTKKCTQPDDPREGTTREI